VWTTNLPGAGPIAAKLPVMFVIHGGGNSDGASQVPPMGSLLARKGVVVAGEPARLVGNSQQAAAAEREGAAASLTNNVVRRSSVRGSRQ